MLHKPSEEVLTCIVRAFDVRRKADQTVDPATKADLLEMETSWLSLARSFELTERLTAFTADLDWRLRFDERGPAAERQDDAPRLQKLIQEGNIGALFERMWLASIVESSEDAIVSKNLDGIITSWNKGAERLFGFLAEEVIGRPATILMPPKYRDEEYLILERVRRGERIEHYETVRWRKDRSLIDISLTVLPIMGAEGKIVGVSEVARDITERKRSEVLISVLSREAEHVHAIVRLSQSDTLDGFKKTIEGRITALRNVHSLFIRSRGTGAELGILVKHELSPYSRAQEGACTLTDRPSRSSPTWHRR
jgi:PAS domain S-box-containing protein